MSGRSKVGDTRWSPNGYHYTRIESGWELTHRVMMSQKLGRPLADNERVTFGDNDRTNLSIDNLVLKVTKEGSIKRRIARLEAKRDEIEAEIKSLKRDLVASSSCET